MISRHIDLFAIGLLLLSIAATHAASMVRADFADAQRSGLIAHAPRQVLMLRAGSRTVRVLACPFSTRLARP